MRNLWRAFKLVLPHRGMLVLYLVTAFFLAIFGSAPLVLGKTVLTTLENAGNIQIQAHRPEVVHNYVKDFFTNMDDRMHAQFGVGRQYMLALCALILATLILKSTFDFLNTYIGSWLAQRLRNEAIEQVMTKLLSLDMPYFDKSSTGDLVTRMVSDGEYLRRTIKLFLDFAQQPFMIIALIGLACYYDWQLFLVGAIGVPLLTYPLLWMVRNLTKQSRKYQQKTSNIAQEMLQNLSGIRVIQAYGAEKLEAEGFRGLTGSLFRTGMRRNLIRSAQRPLTSALMGLGGVAILWFGGSNVLEDPVNHPAANFLVFIGAMAMLYDPVTAVMTSIGEIAEFLPNAERIFQILDVKPTICDLPNAGVAPRLTKELVFENLSFDYGSGPVLKDFNLTLKAGEKLGIVGRTGVGKSTLLSLLLRFYDPTSGRILIDGVDIRSVTLASLRTQIALVTQQPFLFHTTVSENIRYGKPGASDEEVIAAAKTAMVHDEIMSKPLGYEELCGERGGELFSGGQKQRIAIARALLRNAPILLLDEATSALDTLKERSVQQAFDKLEANRTCLIVAHRLSTLESANRILVFKDDGGVEAIGTHIELLSISPTYKRMWEAQNGSERSAMSLKNDDLARSY